jgi:hypothetical protein
MEIILRFFTAMRSMAMSSLSLRESDTDRKFLKVWAFEFAQAPKEHMQSVVACGLQLVQNLAKLVACLLSFLGLHNNQHACKGICKSVQRVFDGQNFVNSSATFALLMGMGNYFLRTILVIQDHLREVLHVQDWASIGFCVMFGSAVLRLLPRREGQTSHPCV